MNEFIHFFTGYLAARTFKKKREFEFETFFTALAAVSLDVDYLISIIFPNFGHGIWTHTILGAILVSLILSVFTYLFLGQKTMEELEISFKSLLFFALLGAGTHLILDGFTYYESAADEIHHMYFWPIWDFPWHLNTVFPSATYELRVWIEVIYCILVGVYILIVQWGIKKENPLHMFVPQYWYIISREIREKANKRMWAYLILMVSVMTFYIIWEYLL
jgi:membrane-bound metal-dependent hydrolase YbcI (DUF457 family)